MTNDSSYFQHHHALLQALYQYCLQQAPFNSDSSNDIDADFISTLEKISQASHFDQTIQQQGQAIITKIVSNYPHITPAVSRDLFWFFGGECLHYMGDEELSLYQQLDELLHEPNEHELDYNEAKAKVFQLH
ncbi:MAG: PA2817 family protein [Spongiibacteraceae bacterium]